MKHVTQEQLVYWEGSCVGPSWEHAAIRRLIDEVRYQEAFWTAQADTGASNPNQLEFDFGSEIKLTDDLD